MFQIAAWDYSTGLDIEQELVDHAKDDSQENRTRTVTTIIVRCYPRSPHTRVLWIIIYPFLSL